MTKITTADCKKFLANYFAKDSSVFVNAWGTDPILPGIIQAASNPKNWVREWKMKPSSDDYWGGGSKGYSSVIDGVYTPVKDVKAVRLFVCSPADYDTMVRFIVLECNDGRLVLGDDAGD